MAEVYASLLENVSNELRSEFGVGLWEWPHVGGQFDIYQPASAALFLTCST
jgi:hypothetical protein